VNNIVGAIKKLFKTNSSNDKQNIVIQDWVTKLNLKEQSSLISVLRGSDSNNGTCTESKNITKMLRFIISKDAGKKSSYMSDYVVRQSKVIGFLFKSYKDNKHWVDHVISAAFHIKRNHPDSYVREYWGNVAITASNRISSWEKKESKRITHELYIKSIVDKYTDIYTNRCI